MALSHAPRRAAEGAGAHAAAAMHGRTEASGRTEIGGERPTTAKMIRRHRLAVPRAGFHRLVSHRDGFVGPMRPPRTAVHAGTVFASGDSLVHSILDFGGCGGEFVRFEHLVVIPIRLFE